MSLDAHFSSQAVRQMAIQKKDAFVARVRALTWSQKESSSHPKSHRCLASTGVTFFRSAVSVVAYTLNVARVPHEKGLFDDHLHLSSSIFSFGRPDANDGGDFDVQAREFASTFEAKLDIAEWEPEKSNELVAPTFLVRMPALKNGVWPRCLGDLFESISLQSVRLPPNGTLPVPFFEATGWQNTCLLRMRNVLPDPRDALRWADRVFILLHRGVGVASHVVHLIIAHALTAQAPHSVFYASSIRARNAVAHCSDWCLPIPIACSSTLDPSNLDMSFANALVVCQAKIGRNVCLQEICWQDRLFLSSCSLWKRHSHFQTLCINGIANNDENRRDWQEKKERIERAVESRVRQRSYWQYKMSTMHVRLLRDLQYSIVDLNSVMNGKANVALLLTLHPETHSHGSLQPMLKKIEIGSGMAKFDMVLYSISGADARKEAERANLTFPGAQTFVLPLFESVCEDFHWSDLLGIGSGNVPLLDMSQFFFTDRIDLLYLRLLFDTDPSHYSLSVNAIGVHAIREMDGVREPLIAQ